MPLLSLSAWVALSIAVAGPRKPAPDEQVLAIVAARDLHRGVVITEEDLYAVPIAPRYLPAGVYLSPEHVVGAVPKMRILAHELVRVEHLANPDRATSAADIVPRDMRLMEIPAHGATVEPGNYVDLWWSPDDGEPCTVAQVVFVVSVDGALTPADPPQARHAGVLVTPAQALDVAVAARSPTLRLAVRNDADVRLHEEAACSR